MAQVNEKRTKYFEAKRNQCKEVQRVRPRTQTEGLDPIPSPINLLITRRKGSHQGKGVRVTSPKGETHRIILCARNMANPIRGNVGLEIRIYAISVGKNGTM